MQLSGYEVNLWIKFKKVKFTPIIVFLITRGQWMSKTSNKSRLGVSQYHPPDGNTSCLSAQFCRTMAPHHLFAESLKSHHFGGRLCDWHMWDSMPLLEWTILGFVVHEENKGWCRETSRGAEEWVWIINSLHLNPMSALGRMVKLSETQFPRL